MIFVSRGHPTVSDISPINPLQFAHKFVVGLLVCMLLVLVSIFFYEELTTGMISFKAQILTS